MTEPIVTDDPHADEQIRIGDRMRQIKDDQDFLKVLARIQATYFERFRKDVMTPEQLIVLQAQAKAIEDIPVALQAIVNDGDNAKARRDRIVGRKLAERRG